MAAPNAIVLPTSSTHHAQLFAAAEGSGRDGDRQQPERHVEGAVHPEEHLDEPARAWPEFQPRAPAEAFITRRQDGRTARSEQVLRRQRRHGAPQEDPASATRMRIHARGAVGPWRSPHAGSPPVSLRNQRMHVCPKSAPWPNIIGQAPAITLISCCRQYSTASGETLEPFPMRLMHPDAADLGIAAVVHDPLRDLRSRDDHHAIDPARDGSAGRDNSARLRTSACADSPRRRRARSSSTADRSDCRPGGGCCCATRPPPRCASAPESRALWFRGSVSS